MPELPEVETVRAGLTPALTNATIDEVIIHDVRSLKRHPGTAKDFVSTLTNAKILGVVRRGKFLWMPLEIVGTDRKLALVGHLGMTGQMLLRKAGAAPDKLTRITIKFTSKRGVNYEFRFVDGRLFGSLAIDELQPTHDGNAGGFSPLASSKAPWRNLIPTQAAHIARDPLDEYFDQKAVIARIAKKNSGIKRVLLDQGTMSGVGNIYADEALWRTKLHYDQSAATLTTAEIKKLLANVTNIMRDAVIAGGTSFDEQYKNVNGESGYFVVSLNAYGATGLPCKRCGTPIKRDSWMNRGSHFCPKCQPLR